MASAASDGLDELREAERKLMAVVKFYCREIDENDLRKWAFPAFRTAYQRAAPNHEAARKAMYAVAHRLVDTTFEDVSAYLWDTPTASIVNGAARQALGNMLIDEDYKVSPASSPGLSW